MRTIRLSRPALVGLGIVGLTLAAALAPLAGQANQGCALATLHGAYGARETGTVPGPDGSRQELAVVARAVFDGHGHWTSVNTQSFNGATGQASVSGTYTVNPDCTGTQTGTVQPGGFTIHLNFVLTDGASQSYFISTDPGDVLSGTGIRQER